RGEGPVPPPQQTADTSDEEKPQGHPRDAPERQPQLALRLVRRLGRRLRHPAIIVGHPVRLRSPHDREIVRLALPALGALAAEPLYVLADTAIVGHLGRPQIAALGLAGTVLAGSFTIFNFLTYGTTAVVARASGAGRQDEAARLAPPALWAAPGIGLAPPAGCAVAVAP